MLSTACGGGISDADIEATAEVTQQEDEGSVLLNKPMWDGLLKCTTDFGFSHQLVAPKDIMQIMFGQGNHI